MSYNRDDRGGSRSGFQPRGRSSFGDRGPSRGGGFSRGRSSFGGGHSFDRGNDRGPREMFKATCDNCGKECEVPFRPTNGKPVYCSDCFEKMGGGTRSDSRDSGSERPQFRAASQNYDSNKTQFDALNAKMDRILSLLEPKVKETIVSEEVKEEVKAPKVKKASKNLA